MKIPKSLIFINFMKTTRQFSKIEIFGPPTKNTDFYDDLRILVLFSTAILRSGTDPIINHLLELANCFPTIYEQIL